MPSKHPSRISPPEGFSIARQVMDDTVERFLKNGGPAIARIELNKLASVLLKVYDDGWEAYQAAQEKINQAEEAERQSQARNNKEISELMKTMMEHISSAQKTNRPSSNKTNQEQTGKTELTEKLSSEKAMQIWRILQEAGIVDEHYQPIRLSRTMKACLAHEIIMRLSSETEKLLGLTEKWKPFEILWHVKDMKSDYYKATAQENIVKFRKKLELLFADIE
jgi:hypothetical protein